MGRVICIYQPPEQDINEQFYITGPLLFSRLMAFAHTGLDVSLVSKANKTHYNH